MEHHITRWDVMFRSYNINKVLFDCIVYVVRNAKIRNRTTKLTLR